MKIKQEKHRIANKIAIHTMLDADIENQLLKNTSLVLGILGSKDKEFNEEITQLTKRKIFELLNESLNDIEDE